MNAQQKARELVEKYKQLVPIEFGGMAQDLAKQCAIITVEFAISNEYDNEGELYEENNVSYLLEVKSEIEKL